MISPLQSNVPIVDAQGRPTQQLMRHWEELRHALTGDTGEYDTGTHTLLIRIEEGRIVSVVKS